MRSILRFVNHRLRQMPYGLRVLTKVLLLFAFVFPVIAIISILMHGGSTYYSIGDKQVTYDEFTRKSGFLQSFLTGIYCATLVYGFVHATRWSRPLCFLPFTMSFIYGLFHPQPPPSPTLNYVMLICQVTLLAWYLYYRQTVKDYYAKIVQS